MHTKIMIAVAALCWLLLGVAGQTDAAADHGKALAAHYKLQRPTGPGPFPAVMLVSGCSGFDAGFSKPHYDAVQARLVELGFLTVRVDYLAARGARNCLAVPVDQVAGDVAWAVADLARNPMVKPAAINLLGWSWGGAGVLRALVPFGERAPAQVGAAAAYYPSCKYLSEPWSSPVPVLVLHGAIDNVAPLSACRALFDSLPKSTHLTMQVLDDAHHGFDVAGLPAEFQYQFGTLGSNPQAAEQAWNRLIAFLQR